MFAQLGKERGLDPGQGIGEAKRSKRKKIKAFQQRPNNDTVDLARIIIIETLRNLNLSAKPFTHVHCSAYARSLRFRFRYVSINRCGLSF